MPLAMDDKVLAAGLSKSIAGGIGGGIDSLFTAPFDNVKTQMQADKKMGQSVAYCSRKIIERGGVLGLYRGYTAFGTMAVGKAGVRWGGVTMCEVLVDNYGVNRKNNTALWGGVCGALGGVVEALAWTGPTERLKILRQHSLSTGAAVTSYPSLVRQHGVRAMWAGASPTAIRSSSNGAIRFAVAGKIEESIRFLTSKKDGEKMSVFETAMAGGTGGAMSTVCNNPADVVKTKMQAGFTGGWKECIKNIHAERGFVGFAAGLSARVPQIFLSQAIQFTIVKRVAPLFGF